MTTIAIIGGTGLYDIEGLTSLEEVEVETPYGKTSSPIRRGSIGENVVLFIARHGLRHQYSPSKVNFRANIWALKKLGAEWCLSVSAVGSLKEELAPGDFVIPNQIIDLTKHRENTFFDDAVAHVSLADPYCPVLSGALAESATLVSRDTSACCSSGHSCCHSGCHSGGTYVCIEGPAFSTRAESALYRSWGASIIGMTNMPEARLAREAELSYATLALVTDYDCWHVTEQDVEADQIMEVLRRNVSGARKVVGDVISRIHELAQPDFIARALDRSLVSDLKLLSVDGVKKLEPIVRRLL